MTRDRFRDLFILATEQVIEFTRQHVRDELPDTPRYLVFANQSYDAGPDGESLTAYPEDALPAGEFRGPRTGVEAIDFLWRDGRVPAWIDVMIVGVEGGVTRIELRCCGRYVAEEEQMYYPEMGPFGVKGPALPPDWDPRRPEKFDLAWRRRPAPPGPA
jgi:hypothetical protein